MTWIQLLKRIGEAQVTLGPLITVIMLDNKKAVLRATHLSVAVLLRDHLLHGDIPRWDVGDGVAVDDVPGDGDAGGGEGL